MKDPQVAPARLIAGLSLAASLVLGSPAAVAMAQAESPSAAAESPSAAVAVPVRGTSTLVGQLAAGVTTLEEGVLRTRGSVLVTLEEANDPRVTGRGTIRLDIDAYPVPEGYVGGAQIRYGTMRIENADGAWEGAFTGRLSDTGFVQTYWLEGQAAYQGLTYVVTAGGNGNVWLSSGLIYPGEVPPMRRSLELPVDGQAPQGPTT